MTTCQANFRFEAHNAKAHEYQTIADRCWNKSEVAYGKNDLDGGDRHIANYFAACRLRDYHYRFACEVMEWVAE